MCLSSVTTKRPRTVIEDIPCFKVLRKTNKVFRTPYQDHHITLGRSYTSELDIPDWYGDVDRGIHAFLTLEQARHMLHQHFNLYVIVKCIIPKGAKYYIGQYYTQFKNTAIAATEIKYGHKPLRSCAQS